MRYAALAGRRWLYTLRPQPLAGSLVPSRPIWPIRNQGFVSPVAWTPDAGETFEAHGPRATAASWSSPTRSPTAWDRVFMRFEALLAGAPMTGADSLAGWPEVHDRYYAEHPRT